MSNSHRGWAMLALAMVACAAVASPIRNLAGFSTNVLPANDDGSTGQLASPFTMNFFGSVYTSFWVNNNGNITFDGPHYEYTPGGLLGLARPIIAAYFADVDTRGAGSGLMTYGTDVVNGHTAFGVEWPNVGYYGSHTDKLDTFEMVLTDRSDIQAGDFDIEFNYEQMQWETGDASGGVGGLGGVSAVVGYSNGVDAAGTYELNGSLVNGALIDGGPNALITNSLNSGVTGRYLFGVRNGTPVVPEPATMTAMVAGLAGLLARRRRKS